MEFQADEFATNMGYDLRDPLIKIHIENASDLNPDSLYSMYHHSHPPLLERYRAMTELFQHKKSKSK